MTAPECIAKVMVERKLMEIVEVGVNSCSFCDQLLGLLKLARFDLVGYFLVDPWPHGYKCGSCGGEAMTNEKWDTLHRAACKRTVDILPLKVFRMTSLEAANLFKDKSLCCVYIDADHTFQSVTDDIRAWLPKIRDGGVICGHDYSGGWQPVVDAVDKYFIKRADKFGQLKKFYEIDDSHYRMESGVWVVEL